MKKEKIMLEQSVGYQLKRAQHALRIQMDNALREVGLTTPQYAALSAIEATPGLSGNKLARQCFVEERMVAAFTEDQRLQLIQALKTCANALEMSAEASPSLREG